MKCIAIFVFGTRVPVFLRPQYFFKTLLKEALGKSGLSRSYSTFADVPTNSCFYQVIYSLQYEVKANRPIGQEGQEMV
jgi:hypothetical protein